MLALALTLLVLVSMSFGQSSPDGFFSIRDAKDANFSLTPTQMREAEQIYKSACAVVQHEFHSPGELHPHVNVIVDADFDAIHSKDEIWMRKWDPTRFAEGVTTIALFNTTIVTQLAERALRYSHATVSVADIK